MKKINQLSLNKIFSIGVLLRIFLLILFLAVPIKHDELGDISPLSFQFFFDYGFYTRYGNVDFNLNNFVTTYSKIFEFNFENISFRYPGPIYPLILNLTKYSEQFTYGLASIVFITEILSMYIWIHFFYFKYSRISSLIYVFLPVPLIFGMMHSIDIFFFLFSSIIFLILVDHIKINKIFFFILIIITSLIRPASLSILLLSIFFSLKNRNKLDFIIFLIIFILTFFYYTPYFFFEQNVLNQKENFFLDTKFLLFVNDLPPPLNFFVFYISKCLYLFGFHPSTSGNNIIFITKILFGSFLLIGFFSSLNLKKNFQNIYIHIIVLSVLLTLYPTFRYLLPIIPLLFINSLEPISKLLKKFNFV